MGWMMSGSVTFEFVDVESDEVDPQEARHEVESMSLHDLLDFRNGVVDIQVERQEVSS